MHKNQFKNKITLSFLLAIIFMALQVILSYNAFVNGKEKFAILPFIFLILAIISLSINYYFVKKVTNADTLKEQIEKKVAIERAKIIKELEKDEEEVEDKIESNQLIEEKINDIEIKGNFKTIENLGSKILKSLADNLNLAQGIFYLNNPVKEEFTFIAGYALTNSEPINSFKAGENLQGQVAQTREISYISDIPGDYFDIESGLGKSKPREIIFVPIVYDSQVLAILELAAFSNTTDIEKQVLEGALIKISKKISQTIKS